MINDSQLIDNAFEVAANLSYSEEPEGTAKHLLKELSHRLGSRVVTLSVKNNRLFITDLFGKSRQLTISETLLWRLFKRLPSGLRLL